MSAAILLACGGVGLVALTLTSDIGFVPVTSIVLYLLFRYAQRRSAALESERRLQACLANLSNDILVLEDGDGQVVAVNGRP